jgi:formylglycine-generating enzyme required for sulfatase activity
MKKPISIFTLVLLCAISHAQQPTIENFIFVEGGTFTMAGSSISDMIKELPAELSWLLSSEGPEHQVTVSSFYIGKYEVTQKEWAEVIGINPSNSKGDNLPIENVSWYDAIDYCNKRSIKEGLTPAYQGSGDAITCNFKANGYRLPTEAEWEYAGKGGNKDRTLYEYAGSDDADSVGWYKSNSGGTIHPVGAKVSNSLGIFDMSGNIWEWCWDWYKGYSALAQTNPEGPLSGSERVIRGGGWDDKKSAASTTFRFKTNPSKRNGELGFRLVRSSL